MPLNTWDFDEETTRAYWREVCRKHVMFDVGEPCDCLQCFLTGSTDARNNPPSNHFWLDHDNTL